MTAATYQEIITKSELASLKKRLADAEHRCVNLETALSLKNEVVKLLDDQNRELDTDNKNLRVRYHRRAKMCQRWQSFVERLAAGEYESLEAAVAAAKEAAVGGES